MNSVTKQPIAPPAASPCTGICTIDDAAALCRGCGRTLDEIASWSTLDHGTRIRVMAVLPMRLAAAFPAPDGR